MNRETSNFIISSSYMDLDYIELLSSNLEKDYEIISKTIYHNIERKIHVNIYENIEEFHCSIGIPDAPEWVRAYGNDSIHIVPKHYFTDMPIENVIAHELVHVILHNISDDIPKWLDEGIASHMADVCYEDIRAKQYTKNVISDNLYNGEIPNIINLSSDLTKFGENSGYQYSHSFVEFLVDVYGYDKLNKLIRDAKNLENIYGMSEDEIHNSWIEYLKDKRA